MSWVAHYPREPSVLGSPVAWEAQWPRRIEGVLVILRGFAGAAERKLGLSRGMIFRAGR